MKTTGNEIREDEKRKINPRNIFSEGLAVPKAGSGHTVYFRPKKMSKSEEGSSLGAIFRSKWELLSKAHKVISGCGC